MKTLFATIVLAISANCAMAQDVPLTQYFSTPLTLNPAMTGMIPGDMRAAANYSLSRRKGWPHNDRTINASYDMRILKGVLPKNDAVGIGVLYQYNIVYWPYPSKYEIETNIAGLSLAGHKSFDKAGKHHLSFGVQVRNVTQTIDQGQQYYITKVSPYRDGSLGLIYTARLAGNNSLYGGYTRHHFTRPSVEYIHSKFATVSVKTDVSNSVFVGGVFGLTRNITLYANAGYQGQSGNEKVQATCYTRFVLNGGRENANGHDVALYTGASYHYRNDICPYLGFEVANTRLGLSYNQDISPITPANREMATYELSVVYSGSFTRKNNASPRPWINPLM